MTIEVHLGPGETIGQALIRAGLIAKESEESGGITIPPGVHIVGCSIQQTRIIDRGRTTGIPFLAPNA